MPFFFFFLLYYPTMHLFFSVSVSLYCACMQCAWSFLLAVTLHRSYIFQEFVTESEKRLLSNQQVSGVEPGIVSGLICRLKKIIMCNVCVRQMVRMHVIMHICL